MGEDLVREVTSLSIIPLGVYYAQSLERSGSCERVISTGGRAR